MDDFAINSELTIRSIGSDGFIIRTREVRELETKLLLLLSTTACGAIIYGRARVGKTKAMNSVAENIREKYGSGFPVIVWNITAHAITEKNFYTSLLMAIGIENVPRSQTALALKERVLNELSMAAYKTLFKRVVLMIDEAWQLAEKDFAWLMDLYNILSRKDILLTCFLFGTRELKDFKTDFKNRGKDQIIGRFMVNEYQFYGLQQQDELALCLLSFDEMTVITAEGRSSIPINDFYFPNRGNLRFFDLAHDYWGAFMKLREEYGIKAPDVPMKYLIDSFILLLRLYGRGNPNMVAFPSFEELAVCIRNSGYGESDDKYENSKYRKLARKKR